MSDIGARCIVFKVLVLLLYLGIGPAHQRSQASWRETVIPEKTAVDLLQILSEVVRSSVGVYSRWRQIVVGFISRHFG